MTSDDYNQCVEKYADAIYRFAYRHLRTEDDAKEIVQIAFEKFWMKHGDIQIEKAKSYLFTIVNNCIVDEFRKRKFTADVDSLNASDHPKTESQFTDHKLKEILQKALDELSPILRTVLLLRDYEGYTYAEIGEVTNLNESQVKVYIFRARQTMKSKLGTNPFTT
ncbi:MAG: RNA polymerase sigma factor [Flavobacterium stagni]|jgi:RNA polymerase sigma-70 factor (ECF subfamily)